MTFENALREVFGELGVPVADNQLACFAGHFRLLEHWNRRMNLTRICTPEEAARRHYGESAFVHRELPAAKSLVDVGSGPGFPGLPLAVLRPDLSVTLVEATRKKAAFLREATIDLPNVTVLACRIEDWSGRTDWALLRAVDPVAVLPHLAGRARRVAILGTDRPPDGTAESWESRRIPWSERGRLWLTAPRSVARPNVSRETSTGAAPRV